MPERDEILVRHQTIQVGPGVHHVVSLHGRDDQVGRELRCDHQGKGVHVDAGSGLLPSEQVVKDMTQLTAALDAIFGKLKGGLDEVVLADRERLEGAASHYFNTAHSEPLFAAS